MLFFVSFPKQKREIMKKLTLTLIFLFFVSLLSCTEDETIEAQVYEQQNLNSDTWSSGEEGYDGLDNEKDQ